MNKISTCNLETFGNKIILLKNLESYARSDLVLEIFTYKLEIGNEFETLCFDYSHKKWNYFITVLNKIC